MKKPKQNATARLASIAALLEARYPAAECALHFGGDPFRLLVMARLSAQCTDARVNAISPALFAAYPTAESMAKAAPEELEPLIRSCGLFRTKARDLVAASRMLVSEFGGKLPATREELLRLPGVGRKIANLLLGDVFGKPAVVADTHCIRLAARWGFTPCGCRNPLVTERQLTAALGDLNAADLCHRIVLFGRELCTARSPRCGECPIGVAGLCPRKGAQDG